MSQCKDCQLNRGVQLDHHGLYFVCDDGKRIWKLPCEYLEKEMQCPDFKKVSE